MPDLYGESVEAVSRHAVLSDCTHYRYSLRRSWHQSGPGREGAVYWVMLNPSTADGLKDDPTVRKCMGFARRWGYGSIVVRNLYCFRSPKPSDLWKAADPVGPDADEWLADAARSPGLVVAAWGTHARADRVAVALALLDARPLWCLGRCDNTQPRHPLFVRADAALRPFNAAAGVLPCPV